MVAPRSSTTQRAGRIKDARGRPVSQLDAVKLHLLNQHAIIPAARRFRGVFFVRPPSEESFETVAVFQDLYGDKCDLIQPLASADRSLSIPFIPSSLLSQHLRASPLEARWPTVLPHRTQTD